MDKFALVTGSNRGIGFETCRQLAKLGFRVLLTSRDRDQGETAAETLRSEGLKISYHPLDVTKSNEVADVRDFVLEEFGQLDVLVNNAGVYLDEGQDIFQVMEAVFAETMAVNFYGPLRVTQALIPMMMMKDYGRVVNVSSASGSLAAMGTNPGKTAAYRASKAALNALTQLMAGSMKKYNIKINAMCPGWVRTRMGGPHAPRDILEGVDTIVWLATLPASGPTGGFFKDRKRHPW